MAKYSFSTILTHCIETPVPMTSGYFSAKSGFKLIAHNRFTRSKLKCCGHSKYRDQLADLFESLSNDYGNICIYRISVQDREISLDIALDNNDLRDTIYCNQFPGLRLEFEVENNYDGHDLMVFDWPYEPDPVFGRILRIWKYGHESTEILTVLEDGRIIGVTDDQTTGYQWYGRREETLELELETLRQEAEEQPK